MTGAQHFAEAERLLSPISEEKCLPAEILRLRVERASVHATLALAAATERHTRYTTGLDTQGYGSDADRVFESHRS